MKIPNRYFLALLLLFVVIALMLSGGAPDPVDESKLYINDDVEIRVDRRSEQGGMVPGALYEVFCCEKSKSVSVLTFRHDDPLPIEKIIHVTFYTKTFFLVYVGWTYALTRDGGKTWDTWDAESNLPGWECCNYGLIKAIEFREDGSGVMTLNVIDSRRNEVPVLVTKDFGRIWSVPRH